MINVLISEKQIVMTGHAGKSVNGQDIVCSAVSALTCNLINSLKDLTDNKIRAETGSGYTKIEWEQLDEKGKLLISSWQLGIYDINTEHNCICFKRPKTVFSLCPKHEG